MVFVVPRLLALLSLVILAAGILFQFFVILSGYALTTPFGKTYFLQASTGGIPNAPDPTRWTFLAVTSADDNGRNLLIRDTKAAVPFDPPRNFGTTEGVPAPFVGTHYYYYMSRFAFAFYLIALFFSALTMVTNLLALIAVRVGALLSFLSIANAFAFQGLASALMTVWTVKGRNRFRTNGQAANLGAYAYGWSWGAFAAFTVCMILYLVEFFVARRATHSGVTRSKSSASAGGRFDADKDFGDRDLEKSSFERNREPKL